MFNLIYLSHFKQEELGNSLFLCQVADRYVYKLATAGMHSQPAPSA